MHTLSPSLSLPLSHPLYQKVVIENREMNRLLPCWRMKKRFLVAAPQAVNLKKKIYRTKKIDGYFVGARMIEDNEQKKSGLPETLTNTIL